MGLKPLWVMTQLGHVKGFWMMSLELENKKLYLLNTLRTGIRYIRT